jgi:septum formation protein
MLPSAHCQARRRDATVADKLASIPFPIRAEVSLNPLLAARLQEDLLLASASPRRAQILEMLGFPFDILPTDVEEDALPGETPRQHAEELARAKAAAAARQAPGKVCIGADTIVVLDGAVLEKPTSQRDALGMLQRLQGRWHTVFTAVALHHEERGRVCSGIEATEVHFRKLGNDILERYAASGEPDDKAGAYAIQGLGAMLVREVRGCFYNVMGFPIVRFLDLLEQLHHDEGATRV